MSWSTPPTFVVGQVLTAAQQNILSDDLTYLNSRQAPTTGRITGTTGATAAGTGFTSSRTATGTYTLSWSPVFSAEPAVAITPLESSSSSAEGLVYSGSAGSTGIKIFDTSVANLGTLVDEDFYFIATLIV